MRVCSPIVVFLLCAVGTASTLLADDPETPTSAQACVACHGENGVSTNPLVPILAGQPFTLIEDNLLAFRSGQRACAPERNDSSPSALLALTMCQSMMSLSDVEIVALAEYFERQTFRPATQKFNSALIEKGMEVHHDNGCDHCHSGGGTETNAMAPILAGQWTDHLRRGMRAIQDGTKKGPIVMNETIVELEEDEIEALIQYYASQQSPDPG